MRIGHGLDSEHEASGLGLPDYSAIYSFRFRRGLNPHVGEMLCVVVRYRLGGHVAHDK